MDKSKQRLLKLVEDTLDELTNREMPILYTSELVEVAETLHILYNLIVQYEYDELYKNEYKESCNCESPFFN